MDITIKEMAQLAGIPAHQLRYYEKEGLLLPVNRESNGFRRYTEQDVEWLRLVCALRDTGMSLAQIKEFTQLTQMGGCGLEQRCQMLREHCQLGRKKWEQMGKLLSQLEQLLEKLEQTSRKQMEAEILEDRELEEILVQHGLEYPAMQPQDAVKLLYQNEFGGGHIIANPETSLRYLREEFRRLDSPKEAVPKWTSIGGGLCRLELRGLREEILPTINRLFVAGAGQNKGDEASFWRKIQLLQTLADQGGLPFSGEKLADYLELYRKDGCHMISHSPEYREAHQPAYRIIPERYLECLNIWIQTDRIIQQKGEAVVAVDGRCGSGKTTFAAMLEEIYDAAVIHMDDFFLPPELRTPERLAEPGGNVDYERFAEEVAKKIGGGEFSYRIFDCSEMTFRGRRLVPKKELTVIEGSYSLHPAAKLPADLKIFLTCSEEVQKKRLFARSGAALYQRFIREWIPMEERYFSAMSIPEQCEWILDSAIKSGCFVPKTQN